MEEARTIQHRRRSGCLHVAVGDGPAALQQHRLCRDAAASPPPHHTHTVASCASADAPTLMWERRQPWESTPTLLRLLKIARAHRLDWSRSGGDGAAQTWSVGDVTMADEDSASPAPYLEIRKLLQFRFPSARKRTQRSGAALNHRTVKR